MALGRALGHDDQGGMITCMGFFIYINVNLVAYSRSVGVTRGGAGPWGGHRVASI